MRKEDVEADIRIVLGDEARALVASVIQDGQKPASKDLENGIQRLKREVALAQGQAEGARTVVAEVTSRLESTIQALKDEHAVVLMVVGKAHRELFLIRQLIGLIKLDDKAEAQEVLERLRERDQQWEEFLHSVMPGSDLKFPTYQKEIEDRALRQLTVQSINAETRVKPQDKAKQVEKDDDRER